MATPNAILSTAIEAQLKHPTAFFVPTKVNSFILDSADFFNLRKYLLAASLFPNDDATFAILYPKAQLKEYVPDAVYDDMKINLPLVQNHCITFRTNTIAPLTVLASKIASFAERTSGRFTEIRDELTVVLANVDAAKVTASRADVVLLLNRLKEDATWIKTSCGSLRTGLTQFREVTITDKKTIKRLNQKLAEHEKKARESLQTVTAAQKKAQEEAKKVSETIKIPDMVDAIGMAFVNFLTAGFVYDPRDMADELLKKHLADVLKYSTLVAEDKVKLERLEACLSLTQELAKQVSDVDLAIQGALNSVLHLSGTCGHMESQFESLVILIGLVGPGELRVLKDLELLAVQWDKVRDVATSFEMAGMMEISDQK